MIKHCTMGLSTALRISIITNSIGPDFAQFWSKPNESVWDRWKTVWGFRGKCFCQKWGTYGRKTWREWLIKMKFCTEVKTPKQPYCQSPPSWCIYLPIFFHLPEPQNHATFNCDQTKLLKVKVIYKYLTLKQSFTCIGWG